MLNQFTERMAGKSDDELIAILTANRPDYIEDALFAAQLEFDKRRIPAERIEIVREEQAFIRELKLARAAEPLEKEIKIISLLIPYLAKRIYGHRFRKYRLEGYDRKYSEFVNFLTWGWLSWLGLGILIAILSKYF
jgi:hypothetical protein